ncbi:hypothetical protein ACS0TY_016327 [Phlomoides rotata]
MMIGDGVLTPAISVFYAVTGLELFFIEPTLKTNNLQKKLLHSDPADERLYGTGVLLKKGDELIQSADTK